MLNILIDAYAVSPNWGSEPGMGWNWVCNLARYCNLLVITEGEWQKEIEQAKDAALIGNCDKKVNPTGLTREQALNMHFIYLPIDDDPDRCAEIRKMCWNQGSWMFYFYYEKWEKKVFEKACEIIKENKNTSRQINILHKLNMITYREPGYLWKIKDIPFVWGPVGGLGYYPLSYLQDEKKSARIKTVVKNILIGLTFRFTPRVRNAMKAASVVVSAYKENAVETTKVYSKPYLQINETGANINLESIPHKSDNKIFKIMWVGKFDHRKQLGIALQTMALLKDRPNVQLDVLGSGYDEDVRRYKRMAVDLGIIDTVHFLGLVPNFETKECMKNADLFLFTSVDDATSTVVPEAISAGLPVVCHALLGFGDLIDENVGRKVTAESPKQSARAFADIIVELESNRDEVRRMSANCIKKQHEISWEANAQKMVEEYKKAIETFGQKK